MHCLKDCASANCLILWKLRLPRVLALAHSMILAGQQETCIDRLHGTVGLDRLLNVVEGA